MTERNYNERAENYRRMRERGELSELTEQQFQQNLQGIGIWWNGPTSDDRAQWYRDWMAGGR